MKFLQDLVKPSLAFLAGSAILTLFAHLQHRFVSGHHSLKAFLVPVLVGGIVGVSFYFLRLRVKELSAELSSLSSSVLHTELSLPARKKTSATLLIVTTTVGLSLFLSILSIIQKLIIGFPIGPKGFIIPVPIGAIGGFLFGLYLNRLKQFQAFQAEALHTLSSQKKHLSNIIETIHDGILVTDDQSNIELANPAVAKMLGTGSENLQRQDLWSVLKNLTVPYEEETLTIPPDKRPFLVQARQNGKILRGAVNPLMNNEAKETGLVMVLQDMSHEKKIEHLKAEFISTATHELNTPISAMAGYTELLLNGDFPPEQQRAFIETISRNAWQVSNILDNLLNVDSVGLPSQILLDKECSTVGNIIDQIKECLDQARDTHQLTLAIEDHQCQLEVDLKRIKRIFCHLISNATKFSEPASRITVRGRKEMSSYLFEIEDQGIGLSAEDCARVFDKFYKVDASNTAREGIGLGLSVVKTLTEAHGGEVSLKSHPGSGTTVTFSLPLP
ncbi:MAG: ATP-binding protein [Desulfuromonadales bacterium]|nr:ATP-binding protein [Desulfuromonadales bacterium]